MTSRQKLCLLYTQLSLIFYSPSFWNIVFFSHFPFFSPLFSFFPFSFSHVLLFLFSNSQNYTESLSLCLNYKWGNFPSGKRLSVARLFIKICFLQKCLNVRIKKPKICIVKKNKNIHIFRCKAYNFQISDVSFHLLVLLVYTGRCQLNSRDSFPLSGSSPGCFTRQRGCGLRVPLFPRMIILPIIPISKFWR